MSSLGSAFSLLSDEAWLSGSAGLNGYGDEELSEVTELISAGLKTSCSLESFGAVRIFSFLAELATLELRFFSLI